MAREGKGKGRQEKQRKQEVKRREGERRENRKRSGKRRTLFFNLVKPKMHVKCSRVIPKRIEIRYLTSKLEERVENGIEEKAKKELTVK